MGLQERLTYYIPQGVFVITACHEKEMNGMTAAWVSQVSFRPRLLTVSIAPQRYTYHLIKKSGFWAINVLGEGQVDLAKHFGFKTGREVNKFEGLKFSFSQNGCPILGDAIAYFECKLVAVYEAGDHALFVGEVTDHGVLREGIAPLIFKWEDYFGGKS